MSDLIPVRVFRSVGVVQPSIKRGIHAGFKAENTSSQVTSLEQACRPQQTYAQAP